MTSEISANDLFESLTGFDEIAIAKAFGADVEQLRERPFTFLRSLVFVDQKRKGLNDRDAKTAALELTLKALQDYFPDEEPEVTPEDPDTESGKDEQPSS